VYLAVPSAMSHDGGERYGYFAGTAMASLLLPLLGGWLVHRFSSRDPNWMLIALALMFVGWRRAIAGEAGPRGQRRRAHQSPRRGRRQGH
jgi:MFS family permease